MIVSTDYHYPSIFNACKYNYLAKSDNRFLAQRIAVRDMYNRISTEPYPDMPLAMGSECVGMVRLRELGLRPLMSAAVSNYKITTILITPTSFKIVNLT